ncbi:hypothetical protein J2D75_14220, partial [Acetobacter suratthaniensis]
RLCAWTRVRPPRTHQTPAAAYGGRVTRALWCSDDLAAGEGVLLRSEGVGWSDYASCLPFRVRDAQGREV